ncbi:uncharacterized protein BJ171DRAFT_624279 [Polychytrium aggregatum]|uniref:uncharacterized protein n=1 Tax=Polychytrium aggregatum TaxID=110093 RepID=UPI0022FE22EF|nr:uncharacterized protein BJ171DRAFT_624279 [Polychytrium aggregatum]KAI9203284.1 hypothetical protein BJ171DRAFT_624279 [Polychytrium aggregatum]
MSPLQTLFVCLFAFLLGGAEASPIALAVRSTISAGAVSVTLTIGTIIFGILAIIVGLLFCFFGYRLFRIIFFFAGFYVFATIAYIALILIEPANGWANHDTIYWVTCLIFGIIGAILSGFLFHLGLACVGALGGLFLAGIILSWQSGGLIQSTWGRILFIVIMVILGIVLIFVLEKHILIISTSITGAYSVFYGIDIFAQTGFTSAAQAFLGDYHSLSVFITNSRIFAMLAFMIVLAIIGIATQYWINRTRDHAKHMKSSIRDHVRRAERV